MSKRFLICLLCLAACLPAPAQEVSVQPDAPRPPFLAEPPAYAEWTVTLAPVKPAPSPAQSPAKRALKQLEIAKTEKTRRTVATYTDGSRAELWYYQGLDLFPASNGSILVLDPTVNDFAPSFGSYQDFGAFHWIEAQYFAGKVTIGDRVCNYFKRTGDGGEVEAWVDAETKLPVCLVEGNVRRLYAFGDPPAAPLQLPPAYRAAYDVFMKPARDAVRFKMIP